MQGWHKTLFFLVFYLFSQLFFLFPLLGLSYSFVLFLSLGPISLQYDPPFFQSWGNYDGSHFIIYRTTHIL